MSIRLKRAAIVGALTVCLLLALASGLFLTSGKSLHGALIAHAATPLGVTCGGSASTPC